MNGNRVPYQLFISKESSAAHVNVVGKSEWYECLNGMDEVMWIIDHIQTEDNVTRAVIVGIPVMDRLRDRY